MPPPNVLLHRSTGTTGRTDGWWIEPATTAIGLALLFGYLTLRAFHPIYVWHEPYLSPTVAPPVFTAASGPPGSVPVEQAWLGAFPAWWPSFVPQSPAFVLPWVAIVMAAGSLLSAGVLLLLKLNADRSGVEEKKKVA